MFFAGVPINCFSILNSKSTRKNQSAVDVQFLNAETKNTNYQMFKMFVYIFQLFRHWFQFTYNETNIRKKKHDKSNDEKKAFAFHCIFERMDKNGWKDTFYFIRSVTHTLRGKAIQPRQLKIRMAIKCKWNGFVFVEICLPSSQFSYFWCFQVEIKTVLKQNTKLKLKQKISLIAKSFTHTQINRTKPK